MFFPYGMPISNLVSYIVASYVRDEKKKREGGK